GKEADEADRDPAPRADERSDRRREQKHRAADDLIDAERRQIPAAQLTPERGVRHVGDIMGPAMSFKSRTALPTDAFTLPAKYYTDAALFDQEIERFYRQRWACVGRLEDIDARGRYLTCDVAGDNVLIVRTGPGPNDLRAFSNVCRHRGTRLCDEISGALAGT